MVETGLGALVEMGLIVLIPFKAGQWFKRLMDTYWEMITICLNPF